MDNHVIYNPNFVDCSHKISHGCNVRIFFFIFLFIYIQLYTITDKIPSHPFDEYNIDSTYLAVKIFSVDVYRLPNMCYTITSVRKPVYQNGYVQYT